MTAPDRLEGALEEALGLGEIGLQAAAYRDGGLVADGWAGVADAATGRPVDETTVFPIFSVSKAIVAVALHLQVERGLVEVDAPVARYWPEYATRGKEAVTIAHVLSHRAGVPQAPEGIAPERLGDWGWIVDRLAEVEPVYPPGTRNTYLSMVFGWLLGEVVRRTDPQGRPFAQFVADEICAPLGMDAFWLGIPDEVRPRVAHLTWPNQPAGPASDSLTRKAVPAVVNLEPSVFNRTDVQQAGVPAVGGVSDARSLARFFAMLAQGGILDGVRLLSEERVTALLEPRPDFLEHDETYGRVMPVGVGGLWLAAPGVADSFGPRILGHPGAGGTVGWADLDLGVGGAICHNRMFGPPTEPPFQAIGAAIRAAV
jgi:CubicO group peptidase (beta-lactamase class C family)